MWQVLKRGGDHRADWQTTFEGPEAEARQHYRRELAMLTCGHLLLMNDRGWPVLSRWIPRRATAATM